MIEILLAVLAGVVIMVVSAGLHELVRHRSYPSDVLRELEEGR